jgi:uncharacterized 2Fe-2S/4Fe-4S cluster protein (DUF4445 family)
VGDESSRAETRIAKTDGAAADIRQPRADGTLTGCGVAVDLCTTTVAAYLYDLASGRRLGVLSALNPQSRHGADVVSRIEYENTEPKGGAVLQSEIAALIDDLIGQFGAERDLRGPNAPRRLCVAGNTTMLHFLAGVPARGIAVAPFTPAFLGPLEKKPAEIGIRRLAPDGAVILLPCVAAYVGADIVADIHACALTETEGTELLIDLGTNGEIVLKAGKRLLACSCAAGPAFEGANISSGVGGIAGAIDTVRFDRQSGDLRLTTIQNKPAVGVCGSGLVDAAAAFLDAGLIDETGRMIDPAEDEAADLPAALLDRVEETADGMRAVRLTGTIRLTQKDVRELQNAKAAIAAGVDTLLAAAGITAADVGRVWLAGGFGSVLDQQSAARIGLYPAGLAARAAGDAAGAGACCALVSAAALGDMTRIRDRVEYIELSGLPGFMDAYINHMLF